MNFWAFLGLKTDSFSSNLKRATDQSKGFEDNWRRIADTFAAGGITTLALGFLRSFAAEAQQAREELRRLGDPIPMHIAAMAELGDGFELFNQIVSGSIGYVLSGYRELFGVVASGINRLRGISEAQENQRMSAAKAAEEAEKNLQKARLENSPAKIAAAVERLAAVRRRSAIDAAEGEEKINLLLQENLRIREIVNATGEHSIKGAAAREALEKNLLEIKRADNQLRKQAETEEATAARQREQAASDLRREEERLAKAKFESMTAEEQIAELARAEIEIRRSLKAMRDDGIATIRLEADLQETINDLASRRLALSQAQAQADEQSAAAKSKTLNVERDLQKLKDKANADAIGFLSQSRLDRRKVESAPDGALLEIIRRRESQLARLGVGGSSLSFDDNYFTRIRINNELAQVRKELDLRNEIRRNVEFYGLEGSRRTFQGDPLLYDRLVQQFVTGLDKTDQTNRLLEQVRDGINGNNGEGQSSQLAQLNAGLRSVSKQLATRGL